MNQRIATAAAVIALVLGLVPAAGASQDAAAGEGSDNIRHVDNIDFADVSTASDSDFIEWTAPDDWEPPTEDELEFGLPDTYELPAPGDEGVRVFNLMGTDNGGMHITDVTDPENATVVARWDCAVWQADVFVFEQGDAEAGEEVRTYAAYTLDATRSIQASECLDFLFANNIALTAKGTFVADVTDPYRPETVSFLEMHRGSHQTTVHPSGDYVYNSAAVVNTATSGVTGFIEVYEVKDLANREDPPQIVDEIELLTGLDSHDMTFNDDGTRLYSAALTHSFVIDSSDPESNEIVGRIYDPAINIHHDAHVVTVDTPLGDRDYMLIGDELAGAAGNGFCPGGGIHVYDVTGPLENAPVKVGAFFIPDVRLAGAGGDAGSSLRCTAHVIQVLPDQELLVMAWYNAGVRVLDYSGLGDLFGAGAQVGIGNESLTPGIQQVGHYRFENSDLWSAKVHEVADDGSFYIFGGDINRTLDVWHFDPNGDASEDAGRWMDPDQALRHMALARQGMTLDDGYTPYCLLPAG